MASDSDNRKDIFDDAKVKLVTYNEFNKLNRFKTMSYNADGSIHYYDVLEEKVIRTFEEKETINDYTDYQIIVY
ncbi:Adho44-like protein [Cryptophlebia peltastica nucleopolyhedrovirus]|uniref:Adho44-like protein n=1 Tax=Cryptophlebia peltastica nucleopolyhedrovirus TaxID=2304025 RepID=A0A346RNQ8_9ABAC|nr:Adho44-like protein [Cryptophlebia peltastica nucleopolyhedrovirus]AXS67705.1 Adho44-like protein [Cryptophlebia peltastica nucleopolyhedrovirus]